MRQMKVFILGNHQSGKSTLQKKLKSTHEIHYADEPYQQTLGTDIERIYIKNEDNEDIQLNLWSMSGEVRFRFLLPVCSAESNLGLYCIDLSKELDPQQIESDIEQFKEKNPDANLILVGTKSDIALPKALKMAKEKLTSQKFIAAVATSAKEITGADGLIKVLIRATKQTHEEENCFGFKELKLAIKRCGKDSDIGLALDKLIQNLYYVSPKINKKLGIEANKLLDDLYNPMIKDKTESINVFNLNCSKLLKNEKHEIQDALYLFSIAVFVTIIAALIGFGIGVALGSWSGPGAFFTGLAAGKACAVAVASSSVLAGVGTFSYSAYQFFKPNPALESILKFRQACVTNDNTIS